VKGQGNQLLKGFMPLKVLSTFTLAALVEKAKKASQMLDFFAYEKLCELNERAPDVFH
jgi:hypothetical protein